MGLYITPDVTSITGTANQIAASTPNGAVTLSFPNGITGTGAVALADSPAFTTSPTAPTQAVGDNSTKIATTAFVTEAVISQNYKEAVKYASTAALPSIVYANGSSGVGATLTGVALAAISLDSSSPAVNDRVLIKNQASDFQNGIYKVTATGSGIAVFVLTRATDFDQSNEINTGDSIFVTSGSTLSATTWAYTGIDSPTMGTTSITFAQIAGQGSFTGGNGITITGTSIAVTVPVTVANGGTGQTSYTNGQLLIGNTTGNTLAKATLTGTTSQITVTNGTGTITLSTPQNIDTAAAVQFGSVKTATIIAPSDSTTAVNITKADGTTGIINVDTTNGRLGVNLNGAPSINFDLQRNIASSTGPVSVGELYLHSTVATTAGIATRLSFAGDDAAGTRSSMGAIGGILEAVTAASVNGAFGIWTRKAGSVFTESFRITSDGYLHVGPNTTTAQTYLHVQLDNDAGLSSFTGTTFGLACLEKTFNTADAWVALDFKNSLYSGVANPLARIGAQATASGTNLAFGVSSAYGSGVNVQAMNIMYTGNVKIAGTAVRGTTEGTSHLDIFNGTAPVGTLANGISLYSTAGELRVMDSGGTATLLSSHSKETGEWVHDSYNVITHKRLIVQAEKMAKFLDEKFGTNFVQEIFD